MQLELLLPACLPACRVVVFVIVLVLGFKQTKRETMRLDRNRDNKNKPTKKIIMNAALLFTHESQGVLCV